MRNEARSRLASSRLSRLEPIHLLNNLCATVLSAAAPPPRQLPTSTSSLAGLLSAKHHTPHHLCHAAAAMSQQRRCRNPPPLNGGELFAFASFAFLIKREKYSKPFAIVSAIFKFNLHNIPNRRRRRRCLGSALALFVSAATLLAPACPCQFFHFAKPLANYSFICLCRCRYLCRSRSLEFANRRSNAKRVQGQRRKRRKVTAELHLLLVGREKGKDLCCCSKLCRYLRLGFEKLL